MVISIFLVFRIRQLQLSCSVMMRYVYVPYIDEIPQWKQCFYDHRTLEQILQKVLNQAHLLHYRTNVKLKQVLEQSNDKKADSIIEQTFRKKSSSSEDRIKTLEQKRKQVYEIISKWCEHFSKYSYRCSKIVSIFIKMKLLEVQGKYEEYCKCLIVVRGERNNIVLLLENLYLESAYLLRAIQFNYSIQMAVTQKYEEFSSKYPEHKKKFAVNNRLRRFRILTQQHLQRVEIKYSICSKQTQQIDHQILNQLKSQKQLKTHHRHRLIGAAMGILIVMVLALVMTDYDNSLFNQYFPIWRGASYILFYLWMLSLDLLFYETSQINYRLIFQFKFHRMPQARFMFFQASLLSVIYIVLFYIFTLAVGNHIQSSFLHYGAIFWLILVSLTLAISPLNLSKSRKDRFYFLKMLGRVILTPCVKSSFMLIWFTEQMSSFNQPFGDLFYTICFVSSNDATYCTAKSPFASTAYILLIFSYRIIQNLKLWHQNTMRKPDKVYNFRDPPFVGFFRGLAAFITTLLALFDRLKLFQGSFVVWLVFSIIATLYSWFIDIKYDWGILNIGSKNCLRQKLLFPKAKLMYYFFAIFDLVLRAAWILTISNLLIVSPGFPKLIFIMIVSYLQIFRRGLWNILRVQNEHVRNCKQFRATIDDSNILKQVKQKASQKQQLLRLQAQQSQRIHGKDSKQVELKRKEQKMIQQIQKQMKKDEKLNEQRIKQTRQFFKEQLEQIRIKKTKIVNELVIDVNKIKEISKLVANI